MQEQAEIDEGRARRLRVLHASDLHIPSENRTDHEIVSRAFLADVAEQTQKPVEIVVFSGDLANTGQASEFAYASELVLEPLLNGLKLSRDRIILVPGNHDVDRSVINEYTESGLSTALTNRDVVNDLIDTPSKLAAAIDRLESWRQFADQFYSGIERSQARGLGWFAERQVNGVRVGVGALNSAWRSSGSGDLEKGRIIVGDHQLQTMLQLLTECDFPLIAVHHPLEWLAPFDADDVRRELERLGAVVLSGHTHQADPHMLFTSRGAAVYGRGGCLYSSREYFNNYSLIDVDLDARTIDIWVRTWWPRLGKFGVGSDIAEDGHLHFKLQHSEPAALAPIAYSDVSRSLVEIVQRTSVVADLIGERPARTVNELLVPPRFFPLPFGQVAAVRKRSE